MATIEKAIEIAAKSHAGVQDKQGKPYILHPIRVMIGLPHPDAQIVAVLHDVVEDTDVTLADIRNEGFAPEIVTALACVTHRAEQPYHEYVIACRHNEIARQVKLADLRDNTSLTRLLMRPDRFATDAKRMQRYVLSYQFLQDEIDESQYRDSMARVDQSA